MVNTVLLITAYVLTLVLTYITKVIEERKGLVAPDAHKPKRPLIPKVGGISLLIVFTVLTLYSLFNYLVSNGLSNYNVFAYSLSVVLAGIIGLIDDFRGVGPFKKLFVFMVPALPVIALGTYSPHPFVPLVGELRLTIVYPILIAILYSVLANGVNMSDTQNGTALIVVFALLTAVGIGSLLKGPTPLSGFKEYLLFSVIALIAYAPFNMYPAKVFNGNCGSHLMGALIASVILMSRREFLALMTLTPLVLNGFSILASIRGFKSKENIERPVRLTNDWRIEASKSESAPITLVQLITLRKALSELDVIKSYAIVYCVVTTVSLLTYYLLTH